jgi:Ca-activated chloride channel family protein
MWIEFTNPQALLLIPAVPLALWISRGSMAGLRGRRLKMSLAARVLLLTLVVLALAGMRMRRESNDVAVIFLVDVSASVAQSGRQSALSLINDQITRAAPRDYIGVIAFGREPSVELAPTRKETLGEFRLSSISSNPPVDFTDVAAALRLAAALVPDDATGRFLLISDGGENLENSAEEVEILSAQGILLDARASESASGRGQNPEVAVTELNVPEKISEGEAFELRASVRATRDADASLRVYRNQSPVAERRVHLAAGGDNVFEIGQRIDEKGFYTFRAEVEAITADTFSQNNAREAFCLVEGRPKVLYLYGDSSPSEGILRVLADASLSADVRNSGGVPTSLAGFQNYDLVIFDNVPASVLAASQMKMVQSYVRELGGGFLMIGGDQSFGPGGYYKTPIEEVLPVSLDVRQKKHLPSLALALVIDKSGSMSGQKMRLTQEAASATVQILSDRDSVGVIAFDDAAHSVVDMRKAEDKNAIIKEVHTIQALGGTNMYPGLKMAYDWLAATDAQIKHIIVLSDGASEGGDFRGVARLVHEAGTTMTSVAVGDDADLQTMKFLADAGGGRFYATNSPENLPRIFTREAFLASRSTIVEEPFTPRLARQNQATQGIDWSGAPALLGYVATAERDDLSNPVITSLISDKDDPVYAVWQYGLGRAAAFTSDAKPRWAAGWMNWPGYGQFWAQAIRDTLRHEDASPLSPTVDISSGRGHVSVEAHRPDGGFANDLRLNARVIAPDLSAFDLRLDQTSPGRYEADFEATTRGAYLVRISDQHGVSSATSGAVNSYSPEFDISGEDLSLLTELSKKTGGELIGPGSDPDLFGRRGLKSRPQEIWRGLLLAALLLLPIDIGIRRLQVSRDQLEGLKDWFREHLLRKAAQDDVESEALGQLKTARARVRLDKDRVETSPVVKPEESAVASPEPSVVQAIGSDDAPLASRLLDAKRRRDRSDR